jgi:hypothetical protein
MAFPHTLCDPFWTLSGSSLDRTPSTAIPATAVSTLDAPKHGFLNRDASVPINANAQIV